MKHEATFHDILFGIAMGDALGVPFENLKKEQYSHFDGEQVDKMYDSLIQRHPKYPPHGQDKGAWSDDTSLTLVLMRFLETFDNKTLKGDYDQLMSDRAKWLNEGEFTPAGETFGTGRTTRDSVQQFLDGKPALESGLRGDMNNGNGTLISLAPFAYYAYKTQMTTNEVMQILMLLLKTAHHTEINFAYCLFHTLVLINLLRNRPDSFYQAYLVVSSNTNLDLSSLEDIVSNILSIDTVSTSGFIISTTQAAYTAIQHSNSYRECMIKIVNMGGDVDSIAAVAAPIAIIMWGLDNSTDDWMADLQAKDLLSNAIDSFESNII